MQSRVNQARWWIVAAAFLVTATCALAQGPSAQGDTAPVGEAKSFFQILWEGAEIPGKIIAVMSIVSVTIILEHFWSIRRATMAPADEIETARQLIEKRQFKECIEHVRERTSMFADVLSTALRHGRHGFEAMHEAADERAGTWSSRLYRRVEYLNIIGNLGPLMGLLGTVLGMIRAFGEMQATHGAYKPENLAGGISLALVNTFLGLTVAIISLGFFGICRNRVEEFTVAAHAAVLDILEYFRPAPYAPGMQPSAAMMAATAAAPASRPASISTAPSTGMVASAMPEAT